MTRAEDLPADLPPVRMVTFAQSFHWMNGAHVAEAVRSMLLPGGVLVHVAATTHEGVETGGDLPHPRPPWDAIGRLIARYLGPQRRAGQGVLLNGTSSADEKSWLNPVEVRFGIIERQAIRRGIFTSVANPNTKMRAFHHRLEQAQPTIRLHQTRRPNPRQSPT